MNGATITGDRQTGRADSPDEFWEDRALAWRCAACYLLATACIVIRFCWTFGA